MPAICFTCFTRTSPPSFVACCSSSLSSPVRSRSVWFGSVWRVRFARSSFTETENAGDRSQDEFCTRANPRTSLADLANDGRWTDGMYRAILLPAMQPRTGVPQNGVSLDRTDCVLSCCTIKLNARLYRRRRRTIVTVIIITIVVTSCTHTGSASVCLGPSYYLSVRLITHIVLQKSPVGAPLPGNDPAGRQSHFCCCALDGRCIGKTEAVQAYLTLILALTPSCCCRRAVRSLVRSFANAQPKTDKTRMTRP